MSDVYLSNTDYRKATADIWEADARQHVANAWEQQVRARLPDIMAEAQFKLQNVVNPPPVGLRTYSQPSAAIAPPVFLPALGAPIASPLQASAPPMASGGAGVLAGQQPTTDVESYIRQAFAARGHDPDIAARVYGSEGRQGYVGDSQSSFGPFQLHYGNVASGGNAVAGLGDQFTAETGLDARDPSTWQQQVDWVANKVGQTGWTPWHGAAAVGIGAQQGIGGGQQAATVGQSQALSTPTAQRTSQFNLGLSDADAYAACGPAAALAFANTYGRNPTAEEALTLAKKYGWTPQAGMAGVQSEQKLLSEGLGIPTKLEQDVNWAHVAADAANGNPVIISTPGHYFYVGQDPSTGKSMDEQGRLYVGTSGTDLKGGSAWMTPQEMQQRMGAVQGALYADHPAGGQSIASSGQSNPIGDFFSGVGSAAHGAVNAIGGALPNVSGVLGAPQQAELAQRLQNPETAQQNPLGTARDIYRGFSGAQSQLTQGINPLRDVPVVGGLINAAPNPANYLPLAGGGVAGGAALGAAAGYANAPLGATPVEEALSAGLGAGLGAGGGALAGGAAGRAVNQGITRGAETLDTLSPPSVAYANTHEGDAARALGRQLGMPGVGEDVARRMGATPQAALEAVPQGFESPAAQEGTDLLRGMINMAKQRGLDTSALERQLSFQEKMTQILRSKEPGQINLGGTPTGPQWLGRQIATQPMLPGMTPPTGSIADKIVAVRYAEMLGNWFTQVGNIVGNTGQLLVQPTRLLVSGHPGEAGGFLRGMAEGIPAAITNFSNTLATGGANTAKTQFSSRGAFGTGVVGRAVDLPGDFMRAADQFFQTVALGGYVRADAVRLAKGNQQLANQLTANPSQATLTAAQDFARHVVYTENPSGLAKWLTNQAGSGPPTDTQRIMAALFVPFIRVPMNILQRGVGFTAKPVTGTVGAITKAAAGDTRGASLDAADAILSSTVLLGLAAKAANGELSGEGPDDPNRRRELVSQGWQPHSIRVGNTWYDYSWAGPIAIPAGFVANTFEAMQERKAGAPSDEQAQDLAGRLGKALLRQTYLSNIGALFDDRTGGFVNVLQNLVASVVVPNVVKDIESATDPYERKPERGLVGGTLGRIGERIPGVAGLVPVEQDVLGRPLASRRGGFQALRQSQVHEDALINAFGDAGVNIAPPRDTITLGSGARTLQVRVQPEEQRRWNTYRGEFIQKIAAGFVDSPGFTKAPLVVRQRMLRQVADSASQYATAKMASQLPDLNARIAAGIQEKIAGMGLSTPAATVRNTSPAGPSPLDELNMSNRARGYGTSTPAMLAAYNR